MSAATCDVGTVVKVVRRLIDHVRKPGMPISPPALPFIDPSHSLRRAGEWDKSNPSQADNW
jgi:hypothetical protein